MAKIPVNVKRDHIEALVASNRPLTALSELIWNALDADAKTVSVRFTQNGLGALDTIRVVDDGDGMTIDDAKIGFGNLGGSWKLARRKTRSGRNLHGQSGRGRFRAFVLGALIEWRTTSVKDGKFTTFLITGSLDNLESFEASDPVITSTGKTGTEVTISNIRKNFTSLTGDDAPLEISNYFALYLSEYAGITINYDGTIVDPSAAQDRQVQYQLPDVTTAMGEHVPASLTVIEWTHQVDRKLYLCDENGISLHSVPPNIQAPGYQFTAYIRSSYVRKLDKQGVLMLEELDSNVAALVATAKVKLREHFRSRAAEDSAALVEAWKKDRIYPYEGEPEDAVEVAERQVFDVVAVNINSFLTDFEEASTTSKRFTFKLVKEALKDNPESLQTIFQDVLNLPKERQDDLAALLQKTNLSALITSARLVANRLDFIRGLEILLFNKEAKQQLLERDQLHQVLAKETWIFGENFHLTNNEETLNEVLTKYLAKLGKRSDDDGPVSREDGSTGRIDLMLARTVPQPRADHREHLVVELKRPSQKINTEILGQVKSYAIAVARDERFTDTKTRWIFWAISNEMTDEARREAHQRGRPEGLVYDDEELRITVWAKTWSQIIQECKARHNFYRQHLDYDADSDSAKAYLQKAHEKYLPKALTEPVPSNGIAPSPPKARAQGSKRAPKTPKSLVKGKGSRQGEG